MVSGRFDALRERVHGQVIVADDPEYDDARAVQNGMIDRHPAAILRVSEVADVIAAVRFAHERGLEVAVRGGGHNVAGLGSVDAGLVIDFSRMRAVGVDPTAQTARADAGATWGDFNAATHEFGLATPGGIVSTTGVAGFTLGGGLGYLARKYGLASDNLISADVVLADGRLVKASESEHEDLFWALRGGGGNFGVVTSFEFRLHPHHTVYAGLVVFPISEALAVGQFYRELIASAPEEFGVLYTYRRAPQVPFIPEEEWGKPVCLIHGMWAGDAPEGEARWRPVLAAAPAVGSLLAPMPYPQFNTFFDASVPRGTLAYWKSDFLTALSDDALGVASEFGAATPSMRSISLIYPVNGAVQRVPADATAFPNRSSAYSVVVAGQWDNPADNGRMISWVRSYAAALHKHADFGGYVNFQDADDRARTAENYAGNYSRLTRIKAVYDPENFFHINHNIKPAHHNPMEALGVPTPEAPTA